MIDLWKWIHHEYPSVAGRLPFDPSALLPPKPVFGAPPIPATWAHTDACLNRIRIANSLRLGTIARYTGLRLAQIACIHAEHFDLSSGTLFVAKGKGRREQAMARTVPISAGLVDVLRPWIDTKRGPLFPSHSDPTKSMASPRNMTRYISEAWAQATADGVVDRQVWRPPNRKKNMPAHVFRACIQHQLLEDGVSDSVIDYLVGHAPSTTRGRHYTAPPLSQLRKAIDFIPSVEWTEEALQVLRTGVNRRKPR